MQGKNRHAMRSGCALWLIVKCCPGALCQTPLNGLHSRKQSVAVTKGLVGTGLVMIDLHWNSEDVSENWVSPESCSGQRECPRTWMRGIALKTEKTETPFLYLFNFLCLENMRRLDVSNRERCCRMRRVNWHDKLCAFASVIRYVSGKLLHEAVYYRQTVNPRGYIAHLHCTIVPEDTHAHSCLWCPATELPALQWCVNVLSDHNAWC